jgi:hypothetical protein
MFLGTSYLAVNVGAHPAGPAGVGESILSQVGRTVFDGRGPLYYILQLSTMGILILAAQTSFADFPRLSSILARDGYFPRQFALRGERLAFNSGIVALALVSIFLCVAFNGSTDRLIGLYAIGVFTSFTLSQSGMVRHWFTGRGPGWRRSAVINGIGAIVTAVVVVVIAVSKFDQGVWMIIIVVPILISMMLFIKHEYDEEGRGLDVQPDVVFGPPHRRQRVVVVAQAMSRAVVQAVKVGETMGEEVQVVHVTLDPAEGANESSASCRACGSCWSSRRIGPSFGRSCGTSRFRRPRIRTASRSCCCRSTCRATGGIGCSTTRTCTASGRPWSVARTSWCSTHRIGEGRSRGAPKPAPAAGRRAARARAPPSQASSMLPGVATSMAPR